MQSNELVGQIDKLIADFRLNKLTDDTSKLLKQMRDKTDKIDDNIHKKIHVFFMAFLPLVYYPNLDRLKNGDYEAFKAIASGLEFLKTIIR